MLTRQLVVGQLVIDHTVVDQLVVDQTGIVDHSQLFTRQSVVDQTRNLTARETGNC